MIGSLTFIMVALRCAENSTPSAFASATCAARNASSAFALMNVPSMTSPASTGSSGLSTVTDPSASTSSMRSVSSAGETHDFSFEKKSSPLMVATRVFESADQSPMRCGCAFA